ncbi:MAG: TIGR03808 family TAT-translocated repetitive protein [Pseudomonadota bacterium]
MPGSAKKLPRNGGDAYPENPARRRAVAAGLTLGMAGLASGAGARPASAQSTAAPIGIDARRFGITPARRDARVTKNHSAAFQRAVREAAAAGQPLLLGPGRYRISGIDLPSHTHIVGVPGQTIIEFAGGKGVFTIANARDVRLDGIAIDGRSRALAERDALVSTRGAFQVVFRDVAIANSLLNGVSVRESQATISACTITDCGNTGLFSLDARDSAITNNRVERCGNNGIQIWRSVQGEDGTVVSNNTVRHIDARAGGDGQNGNGINVFRAGAVQVNSNRITDCTFTAIRGNAASDIQMVGNHCLRLGEVALYAEFGFDGAVIANNLIDGASTGISVTNFNDGGRLAVVQGNLIRNLKLRDHEDARGVGIGVEADTAVVGNVIENAPSVGLAIGWGRYMRDVTATSNIIRNAPIGIGISGVRGAGPVFVTNNMLSGTPNGAIRMMDHGRAEGPDLARAEAGKQTNFTVFANVSA